MPKGIAGRVVCSVDGCTKLVHTSGFCDGHLSRWRRHGDPLAGRTGKARTVTADGYITIRRMGHPLARPNGVVLEHRAVLYDKVGPGAHPCHWCGRTLRWDAHRRSVEALTTDHLDNSKDNNDPANLVASCLPCNSARLDHTPQAEAAKRGAAIRAATRTHCIRGHEWTEANVYRRANGTSFCRECRRA